MLALPELRSCRLLLLILSRRPMVLAINCACRCAKVHQTMGEHVSLESGYIDRHFAVGEHGGSIAKPIVFSCLPLLLVLYNVHAWCT
jgi:hypothetical protein